MARSSSGRRQPVCPSSHHQSDKQYHDVWHSRYARQEERATPAYEVPDYHQHHHSWQQQWRGSTPPPTTPSRHPVQVELENSGTIASEGSAVADKQGAVVTPSNW
eukprot:CAMPEP_0183325244 /NCGR_PEP_ID=MMETSP0160_2-20130417/79072_1 /TAXON_ID=2839 ORGANISM="Odontella Sinensis, Strain Grunow 1884" /NCGR_SAMPLE_ID=MMETSP0160_2 /ASSEMBLY_ACC=CAM_ASM_000250 /LENGTH=104 /DNA_ID=CAMNT_0025492993 /DNA_START=388 /DNA_END=699 /DNA_ORIENTATION=+